MFSRVFKQIKDYRLFDLWIYLVTLPGALGPRYIVSCVIGFPDLHFLEVQENQDRSDIQDERMLLYYIYIYLYLFIPGVTKECFLEAFEYLKTSKKHGTLCNPWYICLYSAFLSHQTWRPFYVRCKLPDH